MYTHTYMYTHTHTHTHTHMTYSHLRTHLRTLAHALTDPVRMRIAACILYFKVIRLHALFVKTDLNTKLLLNRPV